MAEVDFALIQELVERREAFIENGPPERRERLRQLQREIDDRLRKAGSRNRLAVIQSLLFDSLHQLNRELQALWPLPGSN